VGIAILDSGISPSDAAEFVVTNTSKAGHTRPGSLCRHTSIYDRIRKHIDFTERIVPMIFTGTERTPPVSAAARASRAKTMRRKNQAHQRMAV